MAEQARPFADRPENRLEFEPLLADLSSRFINLAPAEVDHKHRRRAAPCLCGCAKSIPPGAALV
jgi:hypothetical protein